MSSITTVYTPNAPAAVGPFSQAVIHNGLVFVSGCIGFVPETMKFPSDTDTAAQAEQVLKNMHAVLEAAGSSMNKVLKTTILLADMADFGTVNEIYARAFGDHRPARSTFAVKGLPKGALIEIEAIAVVDK